MGKSMKDLFAKLAVGVAVGFLGAIPMASAAGFYHGQMPNGSVDPTVVASGIILFFLAVALIGPVLRAGSSLLSALGRSETRPGPAVALGLIAGGTLCVVASLVFAWSSYRSDVAATGQAMTQMMGRMKEMGITNFNFNFPTPDAGSSAGPMILTILAFLLGSSLIGLGVWSSMGSRPVSADAYPNNRALKVPIAAADESRL